MKIKGFKGLYRIRKKPTAGAASRSMVTAVQNGLAVVVDDRGCWVDDNDQVKFRVKMFVQGRRFNKL